MSFSEDDSRWMQEALREAEKALVHEDVPIGAIAVYQGEIIGRGYNRREADQDPTAHAEMIAIRQAAQVIGYWRLEAVTLYCTLEPCAMCAGAMVLARLPRLVYATTDPKAGAGGSVMDIARHPALNHQVQIESGLYATEAAEQIRAFFRMLRARGEK
ncbi:MAG: tRNA adenosine(34) deaminase TadA [Anaerolineae bacterium]|nr:tRNA adenosine(34) deaminase TadA [Anaerolineae bacterium]